MADGYAIVWTDGAVTENDIQTELKEGRWVPLMVFRPKENPDAPPTVITFRDYLTAKAFYKKNLPKEWLKSGAVSLFAMRDDDLKAFESRGWKVEWQMYARRMMEHPTLAVGFEIHEIPYDPEVWIE